MSRGRASTLALLGARRFLALFVTQFLGATNDNLFKSAIGILIVYRLMASDAARGAALVSAAAAVFNLPYVLFSSLAGELADRIEKARLIRLVKCFEIAIVVVGSATLFWGHPWALIAALFLLGVHSTFFGPLKYAILPQYLTAEELVGGNALIAAGTFLAILIGTIVGALSVLAPGGLGLTSALMLAVALAGLAASLALPRAPANHPGLAIDWNLVRATGRVLGAGRINRPVRLALIGIGWFWGVGAVYLAQLPAFAHAVLAVDQTAVTLMLATFSVGIGAGSLACARLLKGELSPRLAPWAAAGMALIGLDLFLSNGASGAGSGAEAGIGVFLATVAGWHVMLDLFLIAGFGGMFTVPLYAILQAKADPGRRARAVAASNIVNSLYIFIASGAAILLLKLGVPVEGVYLACAIANGLVAALAFRLVSDRPVSGVAG